MPKPLNTVLAQIAEKTPPKVILVGGSSEFLSQRAFRDIRDAIVAGGCSLRHVERSSKFERRTKKSIILTSSFELRTSNFNA